MDNRQYSDQNSSEITAICVDPLFHFWRWKEWAFYRALRMELMRLDARNHFTHVIFHIAYPSLVYFDQLKHLLPEKVGIVEHWSIYHYNFYSTQRPHRLRSLFQHNLPVLTVSETLKKDLLEFSGENLSIELLPNVVDDALFFHHNTNPGNHYFMAALWKSPKDPMALLRELAHLRSENKIIQLRIAGDGPLLPAMQEFIQEHQMQDQITCLGKLSSERIAEELNVAKGMLLPTQYETFSVITAEALACGCPVIADDVEALSELIHQHNGVLRASHESWSQAIGRFESSSFNRREIANSAHARFGYDVVGQRFFCFLQELS